MRLFQLVILVGQLFHIHLAVWELPGQLSSGGVELYQFRFMLCLVLGSGLLKLDFLQAVIDRLQALESSRAVIELLNCLALIGKSEGLVNQFKTTDQYLRDQDKQVNIAS